MAGVIVLLLVIGVSFAGIISHLRHDASVDKLVADLESQLAQLRMDRTRYAQRLDEEQRFAEQREQASEAKKKRLLEADASTRFATPDTIDLEGCFPLVVVRSTQNPGDLALIAKAESYSANHPAVIFNPLDSWVPREGEDTWRDPAKRSWWFSTFDGIQVAGSVNREALVYYAQVISVLRSGKQLGFPIKGARLVYWAKSAKHDTFSLLNRSFVDVSVVTLRYEWYQHSGPCAAAWHQGVRTVVFDASGKMLLIVDPGPRNFTVS